MALDRQTIDAIRRHGPSLDRVARQYGVSGTALLAKLITGESGGNRNARSSAGARKLGQFIPGTRAALLKRTGVDAYGSVDDQVHAAALYVREVHGLKGYNPGMPTYTKYILGQKVGPFKGGSRAPLSGSLITPRVKTTPGVSRAPERAQAALGFLFAQSHQDPGALAAAGVTTQPYYGQNGLLSLVETLGSLQDTPAKMNVSFKKQRFGGASGGGSGGGGVGSGGGSVRFASGADRAGASTKPAVKQFVRKISGIAGEPLTVGTGTNHSHLTVDGNVSDHWSGHAGDIPATGKKLIQLGQAALIAAGMNPKKARQQKGGLYNVGHHQVIFNTHLGGDHTNHLHVSAY